MTTSIESRLPFPPFTPETAAQKIRMAEDAWNSHDPQRVALAYTPDLHLSRHSMADKALGRAHDKILFGLSPIEGDPRHENLRNGLRVQGRMRRSGTRCPMATRAKTQCKGG